ncbi:MAG TPA: YceH family protein [Geobacteraceae bacterium]|nr:YceH family protein [Geobacteraceae bacterium]
MNLPLSAIEARILGALIEKELTTPEYYPLTLNSLTNACNQKSNRDPVMSLEEVDLVRALDKLRMKGVARQSAEGGRVPKYCHSLGEKLPPPELAILAELLLRGPQTLGELRSRAERMSPFADLAAVEETLRELEEFSPPLVVLLPRQPGQKEQRYAHLLSGEPQLPVAERQAPPETARLKVMEEDERIGALENEVAALRAEVAELKKTVEEFKSQFE